MSTAMESKGSSKIDGAISVLILTTIAYVAAFAYEATYLSHFGIPVEFVDVTLRELLLYGATALGFMFVAIFFSAFLWEFFLKTLPPALSKIVFIFTLMAVAATALMLLTGHFQPTMIAGAIGPLLLIICLLFVIPIFRFSHISSYRRRLMATYAGSSSSDSFRLPSFLWLPVPNGVFPLAAGTVVSVLFAIAFGEFRARTQSEFPVLSSPDPCVVLRMSSEGYLCADIDLQKRITLGRFKIIDPKSADVHFVKVGRLKTVATLISASRGAGSSDEQRKFTAEQAKPTSPTDHSIPAAQQ
jgi:hypothetical protein